MRRKSGSCPQVGGASPAARPVEKFRSAPERLKLVVAESSVSSLLRHRTGHRLKTNATEECVYTKRQSQCCDNSAIMLAILFSLKTMELLQNGAETHFQVIPLFSVMQYR